MRLQLLQLAESDSVGALSVHICQAELFECGSGSANRGNREYLLKGSTKDQSFQRLQTLKHFKQSNADLSVLLVIPIAETRDFDLPDISRLNLRDVIQSFNNLCCFPSFESSVCSVRRSKVAGTTGEPLATDSDMLMSTVLNRWRFGSFDSSFDISGGFVIW